MNIDFAPRPAADAIHPRHNRYYFKLLIDFYQFLIPPQSNVLHIGCKDGYLLRMIHAQVGIGIDSDPLWIERARNTNTPYSFHCGKIAECPIRVPLDYILISSSVTQSGNILQLLEEIKTLCTPTTKILLETRSAPLNRFARSLQKLDLVGYEEVTHQFSMQHMRNFLELAGFEKIVERSGVLFPWYIPILSWLYNTCIPMIPGMDMLGFIRCTIARLPQPIEHKTTAIKSNQLSVSIIVTCKNEKGNIEQTVQRCPSIGTSTELIFVEGHSSDGTLEEIHRVKAVYPEKNMTIVAQKAAGKGNAVREAIAVARGDIIIILDGDLTVNPEELPAFYEALVLHKGDFINGSRLVYPVESNAMPLINMFANKGFSKIISAITGQEVSDTLCGTKAFYRKDFTRLVNNRIIFGLKDPFGDFDLLFGAARAGCKIIDVPVHYKKRVYGGSNVHKSSLASFYYGLLLLRICWRTRTQFRTYK